MLRSGGLVAFPTETVYGLGCDASNPSALARLYAVKGRPRDHPVIVHIPGAASLSEWAESVPASAAGLAEAYWPGPLTLVLRRTSRVPDAVTGGRDTVALRVPDQPVAHALLESFGGGVAAPSANRFGCVSPTRADHVRAELGTDVDLVLDDGPCTVGVESTIVDCTSDPAAVLRLGSVSTDEIAAVVGGAVDVRTAGETPAPGTLRAHYSPLARVVVLGAEDVAATAVGMLARGQRVGLLAQEPVPVGLPNGLVVLDPPANVDDYARVLYARLRDADRLELDIVMAVPPGSHGIGAAVADRLARASAT